MRVVKKGWGFEEIWADEPAYCGKNLVFNDGARFSMHYHAVKDETWYIQSGIFKLRWIDTKTANIQEQLLTPGQTWRNPPLMPHQLVCLQAGTVVETSTYDDPNDNYRVLPGDSQT
jgi:mannose-6-phosphate isomerase-like protein (cupin superfamily)